MSEALAPDPWSACSSHGPGRLINATLLHVSGSRVVRPTSAVLVDALYANYGAAGDCDVRSWAVSEDSCAFSPQIVAAEKPAVAFHDARCIPQACAVVRGRRRAVLEGLVTELRPTREMKRAVEEGFFTCWFASGNVGPSRYRHGTPAQVLGASSDLWATSASA